MTFNSVVELIKVAVKMRQNLMIKGRKAASRLLNLKEAVGIPATKIWSLGQ